MYLSWYLLVWKYKKFANFDHCIEAKYSMEIICNIEISDNVDLEKLIWANSMIY